MSARAQDIGAVTGVDLADEGWIKQARAKRARAAHEPSVQDEIARLTQRISWLQRKASRLPLGNGKRKTQLEVARLQALAGLLPAALSGRSSVKLAPVGSRHQQRTILLLNEIASVE